MIYESVYALQCFTEPLTLTPSGDFFIFSMAETPLELVIGSEVKPLGLSANWQTFVFTPIQMHFIKNLEKLKNIQAASLSVGWSEQNGQKFIGSRKFQRYLGCRMQALTTRTAMGADAWWQYAQDLVRGKKEKYLATCECGWSEEITAYEAELARGDDMAYGYRCPKCTRDAQIKFTVEEFKPAREQVVGWQEWGSRVEPKVERVHHQFSKEEIIFESGGNENAQ